MIYLSLKLSTPCLIYSFTDLYYTLSLEGLVELGGSLSTDVFVVNR